MNFSFRKTILITLVPVLAVASLPFAQASAAGVDDPPGEPSNERLERAWARQNRVYERIGKHFERSDAFIEKVQNLIDRAADNGRDVSAVQAALDAFEAAIKDVHPVYESANGIINSHQGFDDDGKVTDAEKAKETVQAMGEKLREIRAATDGTGRALREALKAFREANPRP